jgi:hypothetical protein
MPEFNVGELVIISDLVYPDADDSKALIIYCHNIIDEVDGSRTHEYNLITEKLGLELSVPERFLDRS